MKVQFLNPMTGFGVKLLCLGAILSLAPMLHAQSFYGSVVGTVTDSTGAVVPDATVTVTDLRTAEAVKVQTNGNGEYSVVNLVPADYSVAVEKTNFKRDISGDVPVEVGATVRVNLTLTVGTASETVEVNTAAPLLQTDSSSLSQVVAGAQVQQMPLNGRNVLNLLTLTPGVIANGGASGSTGLDQQGKRSAGGLGWGNYQIGGAISGQAAQFVDGAVNNFLGANIVALVPTQDAVQEFSVVSSDASADFGRYAGGVVNLATKSGSNAFHGTAYEYIRNTAFNANDWFSNNNGQPRQEWDQNQYGAAVTGPIKRDKAFFMFGWEGFQEVIGYLNPTNVPTVAMQNGIFTNAITDPLGNCNIVHDAAAGTWTITNLYAAGPTGGTCGDPTNRVLKTYYPAPNSTANPAANWFLSTPLGNKQNQYNGRIDYTLSEKQRFFGRYTYWNVKDSNSSEFGDKGFGGTTWPTADVAQHLFTQQVVLGDTYTFNPSTVLDVRVDYSRLTNPDNPQDVNVDEAQFDQYNPNKYYTALSPQMSVHTLPTYVLNGSHNLFSMNNFGNYSIFWYNNYHLSANLTKILGSHTIKVGGEGRLMDSSATGFVGEGAGGYNYTGAFTGDEFASFLMGYPTQAQFQTYNKAAGYIYYQAYYVTDNWQVGRKLTLNLGLRYELPGAIAERNNKMAVLLPNAIDPYTGIKGTEALVDTSLYKPRTVMQEKYALFAPRVGFAYRATTDTVLHGGYGLSYLPNDLSGVFGFGVMPYFSILNSNYTTVNVPTTGAPTQLQTILGGIVASGIAPSPGRSQPNFMTQFGNLNKYLSQNIAAPDPYQSYPYTQQWNLALSHQFPGDTMMEIGYAGLHGTNMPGLGTFQGHFSIDELGSQYYSMGAAALSATATTCPNAPGLAGQISVGQCLRPNPYYNNVYDTNKLVGWQNYNSLQVKGEKRFKSAGIIMANYVWAKNMSNGDSELGNLEQGSGNQVVTTPQDFNNLRGEYSLISFDVHQRFVASYLLNLPFGKGQRFGGGLSGFANGAASGWALNGITIYQSGFPIFLQTANPNLLTQSFGGGQLRPSVVPNCSKQISGGGEARVRAGAWFNTSCFVYPSSSYDPTGQVTFGNEPRVDANLRADGIKNFDMALQKSTPIHESVSFVFRAEFFNIFNRVQFDSPVNSLGSKGFGEPTFQVNHPRQIQFSGRINF
jgi:hypothetical protein